MERINKKHSEHFLPLGQIDLSYFNADWKGFCPIVSTIEPCEGGLFAEDAQEHHSYYCRENWIGYRLVNHELKYLRDWRLFNREDNQPYYKSVIEGYDKAKAHFEKVGRLNPYLFSDTDDTWDSAKRAVELAWLGGNHMKEIGLSVRTSRLNTLAQKHFHLLKMEGLSNTFAV